MLQLDLAVARANPVYTVLADVLVIVINPEGGCGTPVCLANVNVVGVEDVLDILGELNAELILLEDVLWHQEAAGFLAVSQVNAPGVEAKLSCDVVLGILDLGNKAVVGLLGVAGGVMS